MKNNLIWIIICVLFVSGCGRRHRAIENNYSGFPMHHESKQFKNTSLCKTTDDVINAKPCSMQIVVSEDFVKGYNDGLINRKLKVFGKTEDYQNGFEMGLKDKQENISRTFTVRK